MYIIKNIRHNKHPFFLLVESLSNATHKMNFKRKDKKEFKKKNITVWNYYLRKKEEPKPPEWNIWEIFFVWAEKFQIVDKGEESHLLNKWEEYLKDDLYSKEDTVTEK